MDKNGKLTCGNNSFDFEIESGSERVIFSEDIGFINKAIKSVCETLSFQQLRSDIQKTIFKQRRAFWMYAQDLSFQIQDPNPLWKELGFFHNIFFNFDDFEVKKSGQNEYSLDNKVHIFDVKTGGGLVHAKVTTENMFKLLKLPKANLISHDYSERVELKLSEPPAILKDLRKFYSCNWRDLQNKVPELKFYTEEVVISKNGHGNKHKGVLQILQYQSDQFIISAKTHCGTSVGTGSFIYPFAKPDCKRC